MCDDRTLSERISDGMRDAAERGVHIGRPRAFVFSKDGHPSEKEEVMSFAYEGKSISEVARILGVNRMTLTRALMEKGMYSEYREILSDVVIK